MSKERIYKMIVSKGDIRYTLFECKCENQLQALNFLSDYLKRTPSVEHEFVTKILKEKGFSFEDLDINIFSE